MNTRTRMPIGPMSSLFIGFSFALHASMALGQHQHNTAEQDHTQHAQSETSPDEIMNHQVMTHGEMDSNVAMSSTGGRDPHAYSGGFTLEHGPYSLPAAEQLSLTDEQSFSRILVNRLEYIDADENGAARYDVQAWFGTTYNHIVVKVEGEVAENSLADSKTELLWSRAVSTYWDTQVGLRFDDGDGPARSWLAAGVQGLAPYWFDIHATAFIGENGRTALSFEAEYDARLTQRLTLKPRVDVNFYGKADAERGIGRGFSDATLGLRMQYQFTRQFVPYIGVERIQKFGKTADLLGAEIDSRETRWVAGLRVWF